jgi:Ca2+/Na+ antiporter
MPRRNDSTEDTSMRWMIYLITIALLVFVYLYYTGNPIFWALLSLVALSVLTWLVIGILQSERERKKQGFSPLQWFNILLQALASEVREQRPITAPLWFRFLMLVVCAVLGLLGIVFLLFLITLFVIGNQLFWTLLLVLVSLCSLLMMLFILGYIRKERRQKRERILIESKINHLLLNALKAMDSTANWYNDENEATRELVAHLKGQGINDVEYQYRLRNGRVADARVGDFLIEAKLSPSTRDIDTLLGTVGVYTQYTDKLNIVIYGQLTDEARERIVSEIQSKYPNKVFLTYMNNPRRQRAQYS